MNQAIAVFNNSACRWIFRIGITVLFVLLVNRGVTFDQVKNLTSSIDVGWLSAALLLGVALFWLQVFRWQAVLRVQGFAVSVTDSFMSFAWGNLLAFITPGRVGELGRGLSLDPHRKADSVALVVIDKLFAVLATFFFGVVAIAVQLLLTDTLPPRRLAVGMGALLVVVLPVSLLCIRCTGRIRDSGGRIGSVVRSVSRIAGAMPTFFTSRIIGYSCAAHIVLLLQTMTLLFMFGSAPAISTMIIAGEAYAFMLLFPFFIANIGLREYSFAMMLENVHPTLQEGLSAASIALGLSALILLMNVALPAMAGLFVMFFDKKHGKTI